jgi:hypothetical protein
VGRLAVVLIFVVVCGTLAAPSLPRDRCVRLSRKDGGIGIFHSQKRLMRVAELTDYERRLHARRIERRRLARERSLLLPEPIMLRRPFKIPAIAYIW